MRNCTRRAWILWEGEWSDRAIVGVYLKKEIADLAFRLESRDPMRVAEIEEVQLHDGRCEVCAVILAVGL
jgi:hypothetical protein